MTPKEHAEKSQKERDAAEEKRKETGETPGKQADDKDVETPDPKGEHPFNGALIDEKIHIKHKITQDDFFLNPELRNFGFVEGEIVEFQVVGDSDRVENAKKAK